LDIIPVDITEAEILSPLYVVCVARHEYIASHIARFFENAEVCTVGVVGLQGAVESTRSCAPDVVVCEYELLTSSPLDEWERDAVLRYTPIVAVSLTRRSNELAPLDSSGIAGFLYLPTLAPADARKLLRAAASRPRFTPGATNFGTVISGSVSADTPR
jgi:DNA-binding NarL/FixJ family response regulator